MPFLIHQESALTVQMHRTSYFSIHSISPAFGKHLRGLFLTLWALFIWDYFYTLEIGLNFSFLVQQILPLSLLRSTTNFFSFPQVGSSLVSHPSPGRFPRISCCMENILSYLLAHTNKMHKVKSSPVNIYRHDINFFGLYCLIREHWSILNLLLQSMFAQILFLVHLHNPLFDSNFSKENSRCCKALCHYGRFPHRVEQEGHL